MAHPTSSKCMSVPVPPPPPDLTADVICVCHPLYFLIADRSCCHSLTLKILHNAFILVCVKYDVHPFFVIFQVSHPYKSTGLTSVLKRCNLVFLPIPLQHHILCSRWNAPLAFCNLCWISLFPPPSLSMMAPKYTNWSTCSTSSLPIRMLSSLLVLLVRRVLHFLALSCQANYLWLFVNTH